MICATNTDARATPGDRVFSKTLKGIPSSLPHTVLYPGLLNVIGPEIEDRCILEAGCGDGRLLAAICKYQPRLVTACDLDLSLASQSKVLVPQGGFFLADLTSPLPVCEGIFDIAVCSSVLMHLSPDESAKALEYLVSSVKSGGFVVVAVLAKAWAETIFELGDDSLQRLVPSNNGCFLREWYPPDEHYITALKNVGISDCEKYDLLIPPSEERMPYCSHHNKPIWTLFYGRKD